MNKFNSISVVPHIPERIKGLREIAYSFWNAWNPEVRSLFEEINPYLWEIVQRNPVRFLKHISQKRLDKASKSEEYLSKYDEVYKKFDHYLKDKKNYFNLNEVLDEEEKKNFLIAYFSAEFGLHESLPIYSGGLGILAGDHVKSASDLSIPLLGVGLLYRNGYFQQKINNQGWQESDYPTYDFADFPVVPIKNDQNEEIKITVPLPDGNLVAKVWKAQIMRSTILLLDTDIKENPPKFREITSQLYGGGQEMRIRQEILLGIGGVRAVRMTGYKPSVWHMNEGHSVFMALERIRELVEGKSLTFFEALEAVRAKTVFTTHTPVPAGNDAFPLHLMEKYFAHFWSRLSISRKEFLELGIEKEGDHNLFNLTVFALNMTSWRNGVSKLHGEVSRAMWKNAWYDIPVHEIPIDHVTNGIHLETWLNNDMRAMYDEYLQDWKFNIPNEEFWTKMEDIPDKVLWNVTNKMKKTMVDFIHQRIKLQRERNGETIEQLREIESILDPDTLTIGFARRFATYKRATLFLKNIERLKNIITNSERPVQFVFAGKAHPADKPGQELIKRVYEITREDPFKNKIVFLENYDMEVARYLVSGVDIWLNTPRRPHEASGTSGQKVPVNGGVNFSVLDGWWVEGYNGKNGWVIGDGREYENTNSQDTVDAVSFYDTLEKEIIPLYYERNEEGLPTGFINMMRHSMESCIPVFNTHRMLIDYLNKLYIPAFKYGQKIKAEDYKNAKTLSSWKRKIKAEWEAVRINTETQYNQGEEIPVNMEIEFTATLFAGDIDPKHLSVELYFARYNIHNEMEGYDIFPMKMEKQTLHNTYIYRGKAHLHERGRYDYSIRVIPHNELLSHKHDTALIRWLDN
ncbi:MAG: alpha-glucan family phosphorylase [Thermotogota bacterium]